MIDTLKANLAAALARLAESDITPIMTTASGDRIAGWSQAVTDHRDRLYQFDMLLANMPCFFCDAPMVRGDIVRCRPIGDHGGACRFQCAACAKAEVLPMFDAEVKP